MGKELIVVTTLTWAILVAGFVLAHGLPEACRAVALWLLVFARKTEDWRGKKAVAVNEELAKEA